MKSPLAYALFYLLLAALFTYSAMHQVSANGWGVFVYLLLAIATFDLIQSFRFFRLHLERKNKK